MLANLFGQPAATAACAWRRYAGQLSDETQDGPRDCDGWNEIEAVDRDGRRFDRDYKGDPKRYLTGPQLQRLGAPGFPRNVIRKLPRSHLHRVLATDHASHCQGQHRCGCSRGARSRLPLRYFYPALNKLEAQGHPDVRFTVQETSGT
jgi:hypothetical protein